MTDVVIVSTARPPIGEGAAGLFEVVH